MNKTKKITTYGIFAAIIIVLQIIATYINIGGFPITLTLIPIIVAGITYGVGAGTIMGLVFAAIVLFMVITGLDPNSAVMFSMHPLGTIIICVVKGAMAGFGSALAYKLIPNKKIGVVAASALAPILNTGFFYLGLIVFFESNFAVMFAAFISINFLIELTINILLGPGLLRILKIKKK